MRTIKIAEGAKEKKMKDAMRVLRNHLDLQHKEYHTIGITSCENGTSRSAVAFALAKSLAIAGYKALYLNTDAKAGIGEKTSDEAGLSSFLNGSVTIEETVIMTNIKNFHMIKSGPALPELPDLLDGEAFRHLMETLRRLYDYIIIDMAPFGTSTDAFSVLRECDATILTIPSGAVRSQTAKQCQTVLQNAGSEYLGVVLTDSNEKTSLPFSAGK